MEPIIGPAAIESKIAVAPADWVKENLGFEPDALQSRVLNTDAQRGILNCSRQWGKSTVAAAKAVHLAYNEKDSLTIVVSPTERQSGEFVRKAATFVRRLGIKPKGDGDNHISLMLPNGSRIIGLPGTEATVRGFSAVSLVMIDEASRVRDDMYLAVRPMLAVSDGTLWLMSTPFGQRGFFWDAWENGGAEWERVRATAAECGRIKPKFLEKEKDAMGERWFKQEYCCEFGEASDAVFTKEMIEAAFSDEFEPLKIPSFRR